jgi:hypothetical protein
MAELTPTDYAFLILLSIVDHEISNTEMDEQYGVRLVGANYARLNDKGYVDSDTKHRPYQHTLTSGGRTALKRAFEDTEDEKLSVKEKQLWAALKALHDHRENGKVPASVHNGQSIEERIRHAYAELAPKRGAWVSLSRLRRRLEDVPRDVLDKALESMLDNRDVNLEPEANQRRLSQDVRDAAVEIGGEERHLLAIGMR